MFARRRAVNGSRLGHRRCLVRGDSLFFLVDLREVRFPLCGFELVSLKWIGALRAVRINSYGAPRLVEMDLRGAADSEDRFKRRCGLFEFG